MCVIINKPAGILIPETDILSAYDINSDGFGMVYYDTREKKLIQNKVMPKTGTELVKLFKDTEGFNTLYHFRYRTVGGTTEDQCHPFQILNKEEHGKDLFFAHNGTIKNVDIEGDESDTMAFNRLYLKPILSQNPDVLFNKGFQDLLRACMGNDSKLSFIHDEGTFTVVNKEAGSERNSCWVSNTYSFIPRSKTPKTYNYAGTKKTYGELSSVSVHGMLVYKGDKVSVLNKNDESYLQEGIVDSISGYAIGIKFKKKASDVGETVLYFSADTGLSYVDFGSFSFIASSLVKESCEIPSKKDTTTSEDETVAYKDTTVSTTNTHGGYFVEPESMYNGVSLSELSKKSKKERLKFFIDNKEDAFQIFEDLLAYITAEDDCFNFDDLDTYDPEDIERYEEALWEAYE